MRLTTHLYTLQLRSAFHVATYSRTTTPVVLVRIECDGVVGYGEASLPQYLGETQETVCEFLHSFNMEQFDNPFQLEEILHTLDHHAPGNTAAKAAVDIALHDVVGKILNKPCYEVFGLSSKQTPLSTFTIGIGTPDEVRAKATSVRNFPILKIKLGSSEGYEYDKAIVRAIRDVNPAPLTIDANQGWNVKEEALDMIAWLHEHKVLFIEQPMQKNMLDDTAWLRERSPLPLIADESCQRLADIKKLYGVFDGINIKLMKSTGLREAFAMIHAARALDMTIMLGCMTETSCAISAASQLAPIVRYADLDGALLISNDCFAGTVIQDGSIRISDMPGIGAEPLPETLTWLR